MVKVCAPLQVVKALGKTYFNILSPNGFTVERSLYRKVKKQLGARSYSQLLQTGLHTDPAYTLRKPFQKKFRASLLLLPDRSSGYKPILWTTMHLRTSMTNVGICWLSWAIFLERHGQRHWEADLKINHGMLWIKYLLNVPSRQSFCKRILERSFKTAMIKSFSIRKKIWIVLHKQCGNRSLTSRMSHPHNFARLLWYFTHQRTWKSITVIQFLVKSYSKSPHSSLGFHTPDEVSQAPAENFTPDIKEHRKMAHLYNCYPRLILGSRLCSKYFENTFLEKGLRRDDPQACLLCPIKRQLKKR